MAGLFDRQAEIYADARPTYPKEWYAKLASLTAHHRLAWDVGTGSGQAAINVAEHYKKVIGTDVSKAQINHGIPRANVQYVHTPPSATPDSLVALLGGEDSVDLITAAQSVHWLDLPAFYSVANRVLRKPGGVIAVWGYSELSVDGCPTFDSALKRFFGTTMPYWDRSVQHLFNGYRSLPFPFDEVGLGREGEPVAMDMRKESTFEGLLRVLRSWSAVETAKEKGVELLSREVVEGMEKAWGSGGGGTSTLREVTYKIFMLAGTPRIARLVPKR